VRYAPGREKLGCAAVAVIAARVGSVSMNSDVTASLGDGGGDARAEGMTLSEDVDADDDDAEMVRIDARLDSYYELTSKSEVCYTSWPLTIIRACFINRRNQRYSRWAYETTCHACGFTAQEFVKDHVCGVTVVFKRNESLGRGYGFACRDIYESSCTKCGEVTEGEYREVNHHICKATQRDLARHEEVRLIAQRLGLALIGSPLYDRYWLVPKSYHRRTPYDPAGWPLDAIVEYLERHSWDHYSHRELLKLSETDDADEREDIDPDEVDDDDPDVPVADRDSVPYLLRGGEKWTH
jgi:hypothetical protein